MTQDSIRTGDAEQEQLPGHELLVRQIEHGLQHSPALTCHITFNWHGVPELAESVAWRVRIFAQMMQLERPEISFESLKAITFHHDYELGLQEAATRLGSGHIVPTKEAGGLSVGMVVIGQDACELVMDESAAVALANYGTDDTRWAEAIMRHELCHVEDCTYKQRLLLEHPDKASWNGYEANFAPAAMSLWDEFYANRYSFGTWADPRTFLDLLRDSLPSVRGSLIDAILQYRRSNELNVLLNVAAPKLRYVAQLFGYIAGTLTAMGTTLAEFAPEEKALLSKYGLLQAWDLCQATLLDLDTRRPHWHSIQEISALFPPCRAIFAALGLHYRLHDGKTWVDVPMTPETNPAFAKTFRSGT